MEEENPAVINVEPIKMVDCFKFQGTIISSGLGWEKHGYIHEKGSIMAVLPAPTKEVRAKEGDSFQFYLSAVENIFVFSICVWLGSISQRQRSRLDRVVKTTSKIVGSTSLF